MRQLSQCTNHGTHEEKEHISDGKRFGLVGMAWMSRVWKKKRKEKSYKPLTHMNLTSLSKVRTALSWVARATQGFVGHTVVVG